MFVDYSLIGKLLDVLGRIEGRKKLQKIVFLSKHFGFQFQEEFKFHFYGPFSESLATKVQEMVTMGLVQEDETTRSTGYKLYEYRLSEKGRRFLDTYPSENDFEARRAFFEKMNDRDSRFLELAATVAYLQERDCRPEEIPNKVQFLKSEQKYSPQEIEEAMLFLDELEVTSRRPEPT